MERLVADGRKPWRRGRTEADIGSKSPELRDFPVMRDRIGRPTTILAAFRRALATQRGRGPSAGATGEGAAPPPKAEVHALPERNRSERPQIAKSSGPSPRGEEFIEDGAMARLTRRSLRMAASMARAGADAAVTIAARTQNLLTPSLEGFGAQAHEARRMVDEKVAAACEGAFAAHVAWTTFLVCAAFGGVRTAEDAALGLADIAEAAFAPAQRTVRANARRLTGG